MSHHNNYNRNAALWAGQTEGSSQQWPDACVAQLMGSQDFLDLDPDVKNPQTLIKEFNDDLPSLPEPGPDLSFDVLFGTEFEKHDIGIGNGGAASCGPSRTISQASSNGKDELESITFSQGDELYDNSFGDGIFNQLNSPAMTIYTEMITSRNTSLHNSPAIPRRPFLNLQTNTGSTTENTTGYSAASSPASAQGIPTGSFTLEDTPSTAHMQNVSAIAAGLSSSSLPSPSPTTVYFDNWSTRLMKEIPGSLDQWPWGSGMTSEDFVSYDQDQHQPSLVVHPPETSPLVGQGNEFNNLDEYATSGIHPIDHLFTPLSSSASGSQNFLDRGGSMPNFQTPNHLAVPSADQRRRTSDPPRPRPNASTPQSGRGIQKVNRLTVNRQSRAPSPVNRPFQRASQDFSRVSEASAPINITSGTGRPPNMTLPYTITSSPTRQGPARGRRSGPMNSASRAQAKDTRNKRMVCIRCKHSKQACKRSGDSQDSPCSQCEKHGLSNKWPGPCVRAHFEDIVLAGPCNFVSQRAINHLSLDGSRRIRRELPRGFSLDDLIAVLACVRYEFDFRVYQDGRPAYTLDLQRCYDYLVTLKLQVSSTDRSLQYLIEKELVRIDSRSDEWEACMVNITIGTDPLALLCTLNNMPSRARFSYIYQSGSGMQERFIDPESSAESENLLLAAQLSRIFCRKVEVKAYAYLQRKLHKSDSLPEPELLPLLQRLGCILLTLRWRSAWWSVMLGNTSINGDDEMMMQCQHRVKTLCRVLYFYYCSVRRKLATWSSVKSLRGVWSRYPDTDCEVWDDFPCDETVQEFEGWMAKGQQLVRKAGAPRVLKSMGLPA